MSKNLVGADVHPDVKELVPLLVNQAIMALLKEDNPRRALKKLRRLVTVLEATNRKADAHSVVSIMERISLLLGR